MVTKLHPSSLFSKFLTLHLTKPHVEVMKCYYDRMIKKVSPDCGIGSCGAYLHVGWREGVGEAKSAYGGVECQDAD